MVLASGAVVLVHELSHTDRAMRGVMLTGFEDVRQDASLGIPIRHAQPNLTVATENIAPEEAEVIGMPGIPKQDPLTITQNEVYQEMNPRPRPRWGHDPNIPGP
jgi:hypothetical protein